MTQTDTPDFQRGVVSAQKLLASVAPGVTRQAVSVPPNAETLVIVATEQNAISTISVTGNTTGISCPLSSISAPEGSGNSPTWYVDVSSVLDDAVTVSITFGVASAWYVYADSGVHMVSDTNKAVNNQRVQYTIPIPPDTASGDHPYTELIDTYVFNVVGGTLVISAPGAGNRIRLFSVQLIALSAGDVAYVQEGTGEHVYAIASSAGSTVLFYPAGVLLPEDESLVIHTSGGNGTAAVMYTIESI